MAALRSFAATLAATALFTHVQAWHLDLPACTTPFRPFVYSGCFADNTPDAALSFKSDGDHNNMTVEWCMAECKSNGFRYAGLEYYGDCYCGSAVNGPSVDESQCTYRCTGNQSEVCGGSNIISIYQDTTFTPIDETTVADYAPLGCYFDNADDGRALSYPQDSVYGANLTTEVCLAQCKEGGYPFAGTEYGGECWCGQVLGNNTYQVPDSDCNMPCQGNSTETCGGPSRLTLYVAKDLESLEPCGYTPPVSSSSSSTESSTTSTTTPTPTSTAPPTTTTPPTTTSKPTTTSTSVCYTTTTVPSTCEYGCGKWCNQPLPDFNDQTGCKTCHSSCKLQVAACFKNAGWPDSMKCFDFSGWCSDIQDYCSTSPSKVKSYGKSNCFSSKPPKGTPPTTKTITAPCAPTTTAKTTTTKPATTTTQCPIPTVTNICKQPSNWIYGYGSDNPVGDIELPVVTCNDLKSDFSQKPFKLYTDSDSTKCGGYSRPQAPNACADACQAQYDQCTNTYAQGCKTSAQGGSGGGSSSINNFWNSWFGNFGHRAARSELKPVGAVKKRTGAGWSDTYNGAVTKCKAQYNDCLSLNRGISVNGKCGSFGSGW
ncbi:WSC-domain-containing protein [Coniochaeta ligniaria NRRL 30616]|uniref:WSC-domain-containing protein n=1 Tax=Coniochaeta ligniaria NRRL 30616 TaxID=1408157 RepID=A0A1J7JTV8_9PEZI|nr:WSC-domain-containing protein [Coniochaeta ligniaria NRRL 30616]